MGFALPAAIASALAEPTRPVIGFTGDGGLMMCAGELGTAVQYRCRLVLVVFNDQSLTLIGARQRRRQLPNAGVDFAPADFRGCRHAHIEGYLVFNRALAEAVLAAARAAGCTVSLDLSAVAGVHASRDWLFAEFGRGVDVVFANEDEIRALFPGDQEDYADLARRLADHGVLAAVKLGRDGAWIAHRGDLHRIAPVRVSDVIDTNGAGDAWAAGFLFGHLRGWSLPACGALASLMGAETVRHLGPLIPEAHWPETLAQARALAPVA